MTWKDFKGKKMEKEGGTLKVLSSARGGACRLLSSSFSFSMSAVWTMVAASEGAGEGWQNSLLSNTHVFFYNQPHARTHTHTYWRCCSLTCTDKKKQQSIQQVKAGHTDTDTERRRHRRRLPPVSTVISSSTLPCRCSTSSPPSP